jgi:hypothetical protein
MAVDSGSGWVGGFLDMPCIEVSGLAHGKDSKLSDIPDNLNPSEVTVTLFFLTWFRD